MIRLSNGTERAGRHRPPRQPAHPRGGRADPDARPHRVPAPGARHPRADDDPGSGDGHAEGADQHHSAGDGRGARVLRRQPALAVHGPDQPAGRADAQAAPVGARSRRSEPRPGGLRRARRSPVALRPHLPDRDAGRSEHRSDRLAGDLREDQPVRLHRDAVPAGHLPVGRRRSGDAAGWADPARRRGEPGDRARSSSRPGPS